MNFSCNTNSPKRTATKYIKQFCNSKLLAISVGIGAEGTKLIDEYLVSMVLIKHYSTTIQAFQFQCCNEMSMYNYNLAPLTMTEIEIQLYTIDENTQNSCHLAYQA